MIEKITNQNLERYDFRLKEWCDRKFFEKGNYGKYQTTEEANIVAFYPAPNTPLEGKIKFSFKETMPVEGTKGPDNPSTITGISNVKATRCGKNLCPIDKFSIGFSTGLTASANTADGYLSISGTAATTEAMVISIYMRYVSESNNILVPNGLLRGETYTFSFFGDAPSSVVLKVFVKATATAPWANYVNITSGHSKTYTIPETAYEAILRLDITSGSTVDCNCYVQVEKGNTATSFEPYYGTNYIIPLNNTYYGGEVDLATGMMMVIWGKKILDGTEEWSLESSGTYNRYRATILNNQQAIIWDSTNIDKILSERCSHFDALYSTENSLSHIIAYGTRIDIWSSQENVNNLKTWLANQYSSETPVTIVYPLKSPFTVQLTPTQILSLTQIDKYTPRLNTVYTDADSVQISYLKSPIRDEYEKTQAILSLGGNS